MADETYSLTYTADASNFVSATHAAEAALKSLDAMAEKAKANLKSFASGGGRSAAAAARQIEKLTAALNQVQGGATGAKAALDGIKVASDGASRSMGSFISQGIAVSAVRQVFSAIMEESKAIEEHWKKLSDESVKFRETLRELANIRGKNGPDNSVVAGVLDLAVGANMVPQAAKAFAQSYENVGPAIRDAKHYKPGQGTAEQLEKDISVEAARTAQRMGIDPGAAAEALGSAGLAHTFTSKDQAMTIYGGALKGLSEGKLDYSKGARALNKVSAKLVDPKEAAADNAKPGRIGAFDEAGTYMGTMSLGTGTADQAAHRLVQNSRVLNPSSEQGQNALRNAGITDADNDAQRLIKLAEHTKKIPDRMKWLKDNDLGTDATREGMEASFKQAETLKLRLQRMQEGRKGDATGKQFITDNARFIATDRTAAPQMAAVTKNVMDQVQGEQVEPLETAKKLAEERLRLKFPEYASSLRRRLMNGAFTAGTIFERGVSGTEDEQEQGAGIGAIPVLKSQGGKVGVDVEKQFPGVNSNDYRTRSSAFKAAKEAVEAKGGDPYGRKEIEAKTRTEVDKMNAAPGAAPQVGGPGGARVQVDAPDLKEAGKVFMDAAKMLVASAGKDGRGGSGGQRGGDPGQGGYTPYRV